jgi:hypothetical protein
MLDYKASIKTSGPVYMTLAGIEKRVYYSGRGELNIEDPGLRPGIAYFESTSGTQEKVTILKMP